jgi:hypothetical protein
MPWLTPDSIPEDDDCRPLSIPADSAWLALVSGALTELTLPYNWQKFGTLKMQSIVDNYYNSPCAMCLTPGDYRVTRISPEGHFQELNSDGTWQDGTGEYAIPAPVARTEGTAPDQNCLAAKNATNVLSQLYESLSESFSSELSTDEAITAFIAAAVAAIGFEFAPITWSIAAVGFVFFEALFKALEWITADLWTEEFSKQFECLLLECVINTAGVVTFDWDCFNSKLEAQVNDRGLSEVQMRLYVQIGYILFFIGGADGLNLAARTTDITNDDCSFCGDCPPGLDWCHDILVPTVGTDLQGWSIVTDEWGAHGEYNSIGGGVNSFLSLQNLARGTTERATLLGITQTLPSGVYTYLKVNSLCQSGDFVTDIHQFFVSFDGTQVLDLWNTDNTYHDYLNDTLSVTGAPLVSISGVFSYVNPGTALGGGILAKVTVGGTGTNPFL